MNRRNTKLLYTMLMCLVAAGLGVLIALTGDIAVAATLSALVILVAIILYDPGLGVLVYAASRPLADLFVFVQVGGFSIGQLWGAGLIAVCGLYMVLSLRRNEDRYMYSLVPLALPAAYLAFTLTRPGADAGLTNALRLLSWTLLIVVVERIATELRNRRRIEMAVVVSIVLMLITVAIAAAQNRYGAAYYSGEFEAVGQGPHGLSSYLVLGAALLLFLMLQHEGGRLPFVLFGLSIVAVLFSLVRTTFLALVILVGVYAILALAGRGARVATTAIALLAVGSSIIYLGQDQIIDRFRDIGYLSAGGGSEIYAGSGRIGIWLAVWNGALSDIQNLVVGAGALASSKLVYAALGVERWAHNDFLELLITGGVPLLLTYVVLIGWLATRGTRLFRAAPDVETRNFAGMYLAGLGAFVFMAFFNGIALYQASVMMGLLGGLAAGWLRSAESPSSEPITAPSIDHPVVASP